MSITSTSDGVLEFVSDSSQGQVVPAGSIAYKLTLTNKGSTIIGDTPNELSLSASNDVLGFGTILLPLIQPHIPEPPFAGLHEHIVPYGTISGSGEWFKSI